MIRHNDNLREITYAILVDSAGTNSSLLQVHASRNSLLGVSDFAEYGLKFIPTKYRYNSEPIINYLSEKSRDIVGLEVEDLEKISKTLFATNEVNQNEEFKKERYSYFGSIDINDQTLVMIDVPGGYDTVYLFDRYPDPVELDLGNADSLNKLVQKYEWKVEVRLDDRVPRKLVWFVVSPAGKVENINLSYLMWSGSENPERNRNKYLLRNDDLDNISNDLSVVNKISGTDILVDGNSGTILGNKNIESCPILSRKLKGANGFIYGSSDSTVFFKKGSIYYDGNVYLALKDTYEPPNISPDFRYEDDLVWLCINIGDSMEYQPDKCYSTGDEVRYKGKSWILTERSIVQVDKHPYTHLLKQKTPAVPSEANGWAEVISTIYNKNFPYPKMSRCKYNGYYWISLVDNNLDNTPGISGDKWIVENKLRSFHNNNISVVITPSEGSKVLEKSFELQPGQKTLSIPVELGNYCIDYITLYYKKNYLGKVRLWEGDNKLMNNKIVNGTYSLSENTELLGNFKLGGSYFDGSLTINLDLDSSAGHRRVGGTADKFWGRVSFTVPDGFELVKGEYYLVSTRDLIEGSNYLLNIVLSRNEVVPVINIKVDGENLDNVFSNNFYTRFKHPLDSSHYDEIRNSYNSIDPSGNSFGVILVGDKPVGYDGNFMDESGNSTETSAYSVETGNNFTFKLLVDPNKYEFGSVVSSYYDPYKSDSGLLLPKTSEYIKKRVGTEEFRGLNFASLYVDDLIDKNAYPIYTVDINSREYTINIAKFDGI